MFGKLLAGAALTGLALITGAAPAQADTQPCCFDLYWEYQGSVLIDQTICW